LETITITVNSIRLTFDYACKISSAVAKSYNPEASLQAWFDRERSRYSPSQAECEAVGFSDWEDYGRNQGGRKRVVVGDGDYVFIYT
jgi:hypothetical protein